MEQTENSITTGRIAKILNGRLVGDADVRITALASLEAATGSEASFVASSAANRDAGKTSAGCLIVPQGFDVEVSSALVFVEDPKLSFARLALTLHPRRRRMPGIHETAVIADDAVLGENVYIGANCSIGSRSSIGAGAEIMSGAIIGDDVSIGPRSIIHSNVVIRDGCDIGARVVIKDGAVIGSRGFGFVRGEDGLIAFPQIGTTVIEDDVEIGANTCVDRGSLGETRIGAGTKIDNLVQVAHNVKIGKRTVIAALTGISGSVEIGDDCVIAGQVGFADHTTIRDGVTIGAKSAVFPGKILKKGVWSGIPVRPIEEYKRQNAHIRSIPAVKAELKRIKDVLAEIEDRFVDPVDQ